MSAAVGGVSPFSIKSRNHNRHIGLPSLTHKMKMRVFEDQGGGKRRTIIAVLSGSTFFE
jgi:hypothetical protein